MSQLSMKVRLFAFGAVVSTLVGTMAAPSLKADNSVEPVIAHAAPTQVIATAQSEIAVERSVAREVQGGASIAAPTQGSVEILQAIFDFILALLGL